MNISKLTYNSIKKSFFAFEHSEKESNPILIGIEVEQKKDELDIVQQFIADHPDQLSKHCKTSAKAHLVITDSNILSKEVHNIGTNQEILAEAYPNLDVNDFYYQILKTSSKSFVAICRKQYVDSLISTYKKATIQVTNVDLGNLKAASLAPYFKDTNVSTHSATIEINTNEISSIRPNKNNVEDYKIDTIRIPSSYTLPFACILDLVSDQTLVSGNIEDKNAQLQQVYKETSFFKKTLHYGVGFLLLSLLVNFFVFNNQYKKWQTLQEEEQVYTTQKETIKKQQSIVNTKEAIVQSIITTGFSKSSYYIDHIIQSQPETVILSSFAYQPIAKTIRSNKPIVIKENILLITGNSSDKVAFTAWIDTIENIDFVQTTTINYGADKKKTAAFEIAIELVHDTEK